MKNLYDPKHRHWDKYHTFHSSIGGFRFFETGEIAFDAYAHDIDIRRVYKDIGVEIISTNYTNHTFLHPKTGAKIPKAQLSHHGQQILMIDLESKRVVSMDGRINDDAQKGLPTHLRNAEAYALSENAPLMSFKSIKINAPSPITDEAREWKNVVEVLIKLEEKKVKEEYRWATGRIHVGLEKIQKTPYEFLMAASPTLKKSILQHGLQFDRAAIPEPYILIN
jgi:hypothetical protein